MIHGYRTIISAAVALAGGLLGMYGVDLDQATWTANLTAAADSLLAIVGGAAAIYYRLKARTPGALAEK
jgi:hypothetical protein